MKAVEIVALIAGGLGLFLFGCSFLSNNLKALANEGDAFRRLIKKTTSNRVKSCLLGTGFTGLIQSSGGTSVLSIGLVKVGALDYKGAIAIIIGANVGTCMTAFLIALPGVSQFMPFITFVAALLLMVVHNRKAETWSKLAFAFSLIFFGVLLIEKNVKAAIALDKQGFESLLLFLNQNPWLGLLFGTAVTLILQSSSAVVGIMQGIFAAFIAAEAPTTLFGVLPIVFGANIGAVIPSILAAVGGSATAKRVAFVNAFMKTTAALLFMGVIYIAKAPLSIQYQWEPKLQLAMCHVIFNIVSAIIFLPLLNPLAKLGEIVFKENAIGEKIEFKELDSQVMKTFPSTGISLAYDLSLKMFHYVSTMFDHIGKYFNEPSEEEKDYILELEKTVDGIDRHLADFLLHAEIGALTYTDQIKYGRIMRGIKDIERIGDYGENLITFYSDINDKKENFDDVQKEELLLANKNAIEIINKALVTYKEMDQTKALDIIQERRDYIATLETYQNNYFAREMKKGAKDNASTSYISLVYVDILNSYERVYAHCSNIAKLFNTDKRPSKSDEHHFKEMSSRY